MLVRLPRRLLVLASIVITLWCLPHYVLPHSRYQIQPPQNEESLDLRPDRRIQYPFKDKGVAAGDPVKAEAVKSAMKRTWRLYKEKAWGYDEVRPVTGGYRNTRNGWGATIIDTMTTALVMGLEDMFKDQMEWLEKRLDFTKAENYVDPFETVIRYLGSMVSSIQLLDEGMINAPDGARETILRHAKVLADKLAPGFDSPTGIIWPRVDFQRNLGIDDDGRQTKTARVHLARAGSHWLEYAVLSELTGDDTYVKNSTKAWNWVVKRGDDEEWPGLVNSPRSVVTGRSLGMTRTLGSPDDSHYEYLIKANLLFPKEPFTRTTAFRWVEAMTSAQKYLLSYSNTRPAHAFLAQYTNKGRIEQDMGHLTCFIGGNILLGGAYFANPDFVRMGEDLIEGCHHASVSMPLKIAPEGWSWTPKKPPRTGQQPLGGPVTFVQKDFHEKHGIWPIATAYFLRPEIVESYYYGWRITGNKKYQEWAWEAFQAVKAATEADFGYSALRDVTSLDRNWNMVDTSESFWGAETLKYLYLIFADDEVISLDKWVLTTEAHPLKRNF